MPVFWPGEFHGLYSPCGCKELDMIEQLPLTHVLIQASLVAQMVKNFPAMQETLVRFLGQEDPLDNGWVTHSSILGLPLWLIW